MAVTAGAVQVRVALLPLAATAERLVTKPGGCGIWMVLLSAAALEPLALTACTVHL